MTPEERRKVKAKRKRADRKAETAKRKAEAKARDVRIKERYFFLRGDDLKARLEAFVKGIPAPQKERSLEDQPWTWDSRVKKPDGE